MENIIHFNKQNLTRNTLLIYVMREKISKNSRQHQHNSTNNNIKFVLTLLRLEVRYSTPHIIEIKKENLR